MIFWYTLQSGVDTVLRRWMAPLSSRAREYCEIRDYETLTASQEAARLPSDAAVVLMDLERLAPNRRKVAAEFRSRLLHRGVRVWNDPNRTLRRRELLQALYANGWNDFNVASVNGLSASLTYPVFLRDAEQHSGPLTPLLHNAKEAKRAARKLRWPGVFQKRADGSRAWWRAATPASRLLISEFCDTRGSDGAFRSYSAIIVGDAIVPRQLLQANEWTFRSQRSITDAALAEERSYVEHNPHAALLRQRLAFAGVAFGRIDYGVRDGRLQVWSIDTHSAIAPDAFEIPRRTQLHERFMNRLEQALESLAQGASRIEDAAERSSRLAA